MIGDSAKVIAPLAGDGIGMAFQSAEIVSDIIINHDLKNINFEKIESVYRTRWTKTFMRRTKIALLVQNILLQNYMLNKMPGFVIQGLMPAIISATRK